MRRWSWLVVGVAVVAVGCAGGPPAADEPEQAVASEVSESGSPAEAEPLWVTLKVDEDALRLEQAEVAALDDGGVLEEDFAGPGDHLIEPLYDAIVSARRTAIIHGERPVDRVGVAVEVAVDVPVRTLLAVQTTLVRAGVDRLTLQAADASPVAIAATAAFTGPRPTSASNAGDVTGYRGGQAAKNQAILGTLSAGSGGSGSLAELFEADASSSGAVIGVGRGGGGLGKVGTHADRSERRVVRPRYIPPGPYCDATDAPESAEQLSQVWVRLSDGPVSMWVSESDTKTKRELRDFEVLPVWRLYNVLVDYRAKYPRADTLVVWSKRSASSGAVARAVGANCRMPQAHYRSRESFDVASGERNVCQPLFEAVVLSDGASPAAQ